MQEAHFTYRSEKVAVVVVLLSFLGLTLGLISWRTWEKRAQNQQKRDILGALKLAGATLSWNTRPEAQRKRVVSVLVKELKHVGTVGRAKEAIKALGSLCRLQPEVSGHLAKVLKAKNSFYREEAARALFHCGPHVSDVLPQLLRALGDSDWGIRAQVLSTLRQARDKAPEKIMPALLRGLKDHVKGVKEVAANVLSQMGPKAAPAVPLLIEALHHPAREVKRQAAHALGKIGPKAVAAVPALQRIAAHADPKVSSIAKTALQRIMGTNASPASAPSSLPNTPTKTK